MKTRVNSGARGAVYRISIEHTTGERDHPTMQFFRETTDSLSHAMSYIADPPEDTVALLRGKTSSSSKLPKWFITVRYDDPHLAIRLPDGTKQPIERVIAFSKVMIAPKGHRPLTLAVFDYDGATIGGEAKSMDDLGLKKTEVNAFMRGDVVKLLSSVDAMPNRQLTVMAMCRMVSGIISARVGGSAEYNHEAIKALMRWCRGEITDHEIWLPFPSRKFAMSESIPEQILRLTADYVTGHDSRRIHTAVSYLRTSELGPPRARKRAITDDEAAVVRDRTGRLMASIFKDVVHLPDVAFSVLAR